MELVNKLIQHIVSPAFKEAIILTEQTSLIMGKTLHRLSLLDTISNRYPDTPFAGYDSGQLEYIYDNRYKR